MKETLLECKTHFTLAETPDYKLIQIRFGERKTVFICVGDITAELRVCPDNRSGAPAVKPFVYANGSSVEHTHLLLTDEEIERKFSQ